MHQLSSRGNGTNQAIGPHLKVALMHRCCNCKRTLPASAFHKNASRQAGIQSECRDCVAVRNKHSNPLRVRPCKPQSTLIERIEANIERIPFSGCWIWTGALINSGYGRISTGGKKSLVHRLYWGLLNGAPMPPELLACHTCDVPSCVNPHHIYPGTKLDNAMDYINQRNRH